MTSSLKLMIVAVLSFVASACTVQAEDGTACPASTTQTIETFQVTRHDMPWRKGADGSELLQVRDVYVCYNRNAQGVKLHLYEMATGRLVNTYTDLSILPLGAGQKCFAFLMDIECPNTLYTFIIEAYDTLTPMRLYTPWTFKSREFPTTEVCNSMIPP